MTSRSVPLPGRRFGKAKSAERRPAGWSVSIPRLSGENARRTGRDPQGDAGDRWQAAQVRLPPDRHPAGMKRHTHEPQEAVSHVPRGRAVREKAARSQASAWHKNPDAIGRGRQRALVVGLCIRQLRCFAEVPDPRRDRRLHARMPVPCGRHEPVRRTGRPGAQRPASPLRQARRHCQ